MFSRHVFSHWEFLFFFILNVKFSLVNFAELKNDRTFKTTSICIAILMTMAFLCLFGGACNGVLLVMSSDDTSPTRIAFASIPFVLGVLLCVCALNLTQYGHQFETNSRSLKLNLVLSVTLLIFISAFVPAMIYASMV